MNKAVKVYLAGGMRSHWQDKVMETVREALPNIPVIFLDPRQSGSATEETYTAWDVSAVEMADILFVYLEADNPSGAGLALEIGVAEGMKRAGAVPKTILFVCEEGHPQYRYFGMARVCSDFVVKDLRMGIAILVDQVLPAVVKKPQ